MHPQNVFAHHAINCSACEDGVNLTDTEYRAYHRFQLLQHCQISGYYLVVWNRTLSCGAGKR